MIATLIIFLVLIIFLAFFIGKNLSNVCTFWLFKTYTDLPVAVLVLIAFGAGIVFSIIFTLFSKFKKSVRSENVPVTNENEKSAKREKTERKLKKLSRKNKKQIDNSSDETIIADN